MSTLAAGDYAPDFSTKCIDGNAINLSDYRGKKLMLSFLRHSGCPFSGLAMAQLRGNYKKLAWASKLDVIGVFQSPPEHINKDIVKRDVAYPFTLLSDEDGILYKTYKIQGSLCGLVLGLANVKRSIRAKKEGHRQGQIEGNLYTLPSDFLIDEDGIIVDCFLAKSIDQCIPLERIVKFLLNKKSFPKRKPAEEDK